MDTESKELYKAILIGAGILVAVLLYFVFAIIRQQKKVYKWQQARIAAEITTLENERKRIAADLHDELGPVLSAVKLQVNHLEPSNETEKIVLEKSCGQIDEVIKRFREISYNLLPNTLVRKGFIKATEEFVEKMKGTNQLVITFNGGVERMDTDKEINLYRIVQEIVHNTIKHARASKLIIEIKKEKDKLILETKDDGVGFHYQTMKAKDGGLGMLNLQSRAEMLRGELTLHTSPGKGTHYIIQIPA